MFLVATVWDSSSLVVLKFYHASKAPGGLVKTDYWTLFQSFRVWSLGRGPRICIPEKFSKDSNAAG